MNTWQTWFARRVNHGAESDVGANAAATLLVAIATALMLQSSRVFLSYMVFVVDQSERVRLATISIGVFLAFGLAAALVKILGVRNAVTVVLTCLVFARLALQFWEEPVARMCLGAVVVVCWGWLMAAMLGTWRDATAFGVGLGLGIDLAIRIAFGTVDLPWMPNAAKDVVTLALVAVLAVVAAGLARNEFPSPTEPSGRAIASLIAVGPGLAVYHLAIGNLGLIQIKADASLALAGFSLLAGVLFALKEGQELGRGVGHGRLSHAVAVSLLTPIGLWLLWRGTSLGSVWTLLAGAGFVALLMRALTSGGAPSNGPGIARTTLWLTVGMLLQVVLIFAYFTFTGLPLLIAVAVLLLIVGVWLPGLPTPPVVELATLRLRGATLLPVVLIVAISGLALTTTDEVEAGPRLGRDFTVMTYNLQTGFARDNRWSLEQTARTIEAEHPDILILQEVSRGWAITTGVDQVRWLSDRLEMPFVFGATSRDGLWGVAILTRAPITSSSVQIYASTQNLRRGVVAVQLETEAGDLWVYGTHLDNPKGAGGVRLEQVNQLLGVWDGRAPAIIGGDFNALPDSDVLTTFASAGFVDVGSALGPDAFTSEAGHRIDYILTSDGLTWRDVRIPDIWTSDHKAVVVELTLGA